MQQNYDILQLKDHYGNIVEVTKRPVELGDRVVIVDNEKKMTLLSHIPTQRYFVSTVTKIIEEGTSEKRIKTDALGGSWREDLIYQIIE